MSASVRAQLLNLARETKQDFNLVLTRYAIERLLYRVSKSKYANQFLLKGALLFDLWFDIPHRPTRDIDFLGLGSSELTSIKEIFSDISNLENNDGVVFLTESIRAVEIRANANNTGVRVTLACMIEKARCNIQIDIGFGDAVTPDAEDANYPVLLSEFEAPKLKVYPRYTVVAEKFETLTTLGIANSRMKDYFDLWTLAQHTEFDGSILLKAVQQTFNNRQTNLPREAPFGLTIAFAQDEQKQIQWQAFLRKNNLTALALIDVVETLKTFLQPTCEAGNEKLAISSHWKAGGPWLPVDQNALDS